MNQFYTAFSKHDAESMGKLYHPDVIFNDPAFRDLTFDRVTSMWKMLIERSKGQLTIEHHSLIADDTFSQCTWEAEYTFSKTGNEVHNIIHSTMEFRDGLIIKHTDEFNFWRWSSMALGLPGKLLGWTPLIKNKVQKMALQSLNDYMKKSTS